MELLKIRSWNTNWIFFIYSKPCRFSVNTHPVKLNLTWYQFLKGSLKVLSLSKWSCFAHLKRKTKNLKESEAFNAKLCLQLIATCWWNSKSTNICVQKAVWTLSQEQSRHSHLNGNLKNFLNPRLKDKNYWPTQAFVFSFYNVSSFFPFGSILSNSFMPQFVMLLSWETKLNSL